LSDSLEESVCSIHDGLTVDWYTITAVNQDSLEDVPMPPAPPLSTQPAIKHRNIDEKLQQVKKGG
jgi:hypothetical protein